ncbi:aminoacyl-tRNA hydrolase [Acidobacteria bacterium AH-259-A15]|nr:aminoacyl-tRNA hydrolase [Acidobacteria bacterium AH-259-A15]
MIRVTDELWISEEELKFKASRSGGPGGQNVNKVSSRVTLLFDVDESASLSSDQKTRIRKRLSNRINKEGILRIVSRQFRTQAANRKAAVQRFALLLAQALKKQKPRKKTWVPKSTRQGRLEEKAQRSELKRLRSKPALEHE